MAGLVATGVGAAALPVTSVGIGWPISALAVVAVVWAVRTARDHAPSENGTIPSESRADRVWRMSAGVVAAALAIVPAIRASVPLAAMCVVAAVLLASYALAGGRTWRGVVLGLLASMPALARGLGRVASWRPNQATKTEGLGRSRRIALGLMVGIVLVAILLPLLRSADPVFANLLDSWWRELSQVDERMLVGAVILAVSALVAAELARTDREPDRPVDRRRFAGGPEWMIPLVLVDALFAVFVVVQVNVLFGGHNYVLGAGGPDYATYARGGSAHLGVVTALALGLAAALGFWARRETLRERILIRVLGGLLCTLTLVIVASALRRLLLYVDAYGFTWQRLIGFAGEAFLGLVFVLLLVAGIRLRADWLPRATVATATGVLLALVAVNPEALMARTHLERYGGYGIDVGFLSDLSADAIDEINRLPLRVRVCVLHDLRQSLERRDPWYELNLAREHARTAVDSMTARC
jgi:hypothetical protein